VPRRRREKLDHELGLLWAMASACGDVLFSGGAGNQVGSMAGVALFGDFLDEVNADHGRMTMASQTRPSGTLCGLAQVSPVKGSAGRR
jgi:hypothetical protein